MHTGIDAVPRMAWPQRWAILFGYPPTEQERDGLQAWLDEQFDGWDAAELHDALELYAERERAAGRRAKAPTGPQVKSAIRHLRWQSKGGGGVQGIRWQDPQGSGGITRIGMDELRALVRDATPGHRWEIICGVVERDTADPIKAGLVRYAESLHGGAVRYVPEAANFARGLIGA